MLGRVDVYMGGSHSCTVEEGALPLSLPRNTQKIFISIDDNERENIKKICDEIFADG